MTQSKIQLAGFTITNELCAGAKNLRRYRNLYRPKHFNIDEVTMDDKNFIPAEPPGKYDIT
jgi:hypothetical protein